MRKVVFFVCDQKQHCCTSKYCGLNGGECFHTGDISHREGGLTGIEEEDSTMLFHLTYVPLEDTLYLLEKR